MQLTFQRIFALHLWAWYAYKWTWRNWVLSGYCLLCIEYFNMNWAFVGTLCLNEETKSAPHNLATLYWLSKVRLAVSKEAGSKRYNNVINNKLVYCVWHGNILRQAIQNNTPTLKTLIFFLCIYFTHKIQARTRITKFDRMT